MVPPWLMSGRLALIESGIHFIHVGYLGLNTLFTALGKGIVWRISGSTWPGTKAAGDNIGMLIAAAILDMTSNAMNVRRPSDVAPYQDIPKGQDYASTFSGAPKSAMLKYVLKSSAITLCSFQSADLDYLCYLLYRE
jgi:hypothetical protein